MLLTTKEVAAWVRTAPSTVAGWRQTGRGPVFRTLPGGRVRYEREEVERWLASL